MLSETDYRTIEMLNAVMPVRIVKLQNVVLANPVVILVRPMTIQAALDQGIFPDDVPKEETVINENSPRQASKIDMFLKFSTLNITNYFSRSNYFLWTWLQ